MATYVERATLIVSNTLGKNATQEQVIKAVDSVWAINSMGLPYPPDPETWPAPETRAQFFVESTKKFFGRQIEAHASQLAQAEYQQQIDESKDGYVDDFEPDEAQPVTT